MPSIIYASVFSVLGGGVLRSPRDLSIGPLGSATGLRLGNHVFPQPRGSHPREWGEDTMKRARELLPKRVSFGFL